MATPKCGQSCHHRSARTLRDGSTRRAWSTVEGLARQAYGKLLASLACRFRDIAAAEDALAEALRTALERWPVEGVPHSPEAWLTLVAKNRLRQGVRARKVVDRPDVIAALEWQAETLSAAATQDAALSATIPRPSTPTRPTGWCQRMRLAPRAMSSRLEGT